LTLQSAEHGSAYVSKNGVTLNPPYVFHEGETAVLTATPDTGYGLQYWSGSNSSAENPYSLVMNGDKTMRPNFSQTLTLTAMIDKPSGKYADQI